MNRRQKKKKYGLSQKEKDERLKREALKHFPEIIGVVVKIIDSACKILQEIAQSIPAVLKRLSEEWCDDGENDMDGWYTKRIKEIGYKGCRNCAHQIEPLRTCEWMEKGGDGQLHLLCPRWERREDGKDE